MKILLFAAALLATLPGWAQPAPDWRLPTLEDGQVQSLQQFRGQIVVLDFWASWCVPCRPAMAALSQLQKDYANKPVRVVPVSVDEYAEDAQDFVARYGATLNSLHDPDGEVAEAYDLLGMPSSFVIAPNGEIALRHEGFREGDEALWRKTIDRLLARPSQPEPKTAKPVAYKNAGI